MHAELPSMAAQSIFTPHGEAAATLSRLGIVLTAIGVFVTALMIVLIVTALRRVTAAPEPGSVPLAHYTVRARSGVRWIVAGTAVTLGILAFAAAYSVKVLLADPGKIDSASMTVRITGFQYWWKVEYLDPDGRVDIVDANELFIPAGTRVRLELSSADVIHSFWIPALAGKTDLIPGQQNTMWIQADSAGEYRGQCAEYCGVSHANMRLEVTALPAAGFTAWRDGQHRIPAVDSAVTRIVQLRGCAACHRLAGQMDGAAGPDLTHFAQRTTIAAGILENTPDNLRRWLSDPQAIKPGTLMPRTGLTRDELDRVVAYLGTLR
jgi:cytochrome c oxidase subunit 2